MSCLHWSRSELFDCRQRRRGEIISIINKGGRFRNSFGRCSSFAIASHSFCLPVCQSCYCLVWIECAPSLLIVDKCACIVLRLYLGLVEVIISADTSASLFFKGASVATMSLFGPSHYFLNCTSQVGRGLVVVSNCEFQGAFHAASLHTSPLLRVTVLKFSDLTAFATSRFFCKRSHSFPLVSCSFCQRSHSFRLASCTSPHSVVVQGQDWLLTNSLLFFFDGCILFCIPLHRWEKVSSSWATVGSRELAAQSLSTPHQCLGVTVLKFSDLTAFAKSRFFCKRSHSFPLVLCSFCQRSHSFRLASWVSPHSVVVQGQGWLLTSSLLFFLDSCILFCIALHRWEKVSSSWATVSSRELAAQPLSTPHHCLRVTVLKFSDLTVFAMSRFFCKRSHSFPLVLCSFWERSHSFRLASCTSPHSVVVAFALSKVKVGWR